MTKKKEHSLDWHTLFVYDETSPSCLRWVKDIYNCNGRLTKTRCGDVAGNIDAHGHWRVTVNGRIFRVHRIIFEMHDTDRNFDQIDHINGVRSDNRLSNLRGVTAKQNAQNKKKDPRNTSGVTGVNFALSNGGNTPCWRAMWSTSDGIRKFKSFSCNLYGHEEALKLAIDAREKGIEEANNQGASYTERHGT